MAHLPAQLILAASPLPSPRKTVRGALSPGQCRRTAFAAASSFASSTAVVMPRPRHQADRTHLRVLATVEAASRTRLATRRLSRLTGIALGRENRVVLPQCSVLYVDSVIEGMEFAPAVPAWVGTLRQFTCVHFERLRLDRLGARFAR